MPEPIFQPAFDEARQRLPSYVELIERRAPYAAALLSRSQGLTIALNRREQHIAQQPPSQGVVLTAYDGASFVERAVSALDPELLRAEAATLASGITPQPGPTIDPGPQRRATFATECSIDPGSLTLQQKLDHCRELRERVQAMDPRIINVNVSYSEWREEKAFANRARELAQQITGVRLRITCFVSDGGPPQYDWFTTEATGGWEHLTVTDQDLEQLRDSALSLLHMERIEPGVYEIVTHPGVTGTIAHESFGHGVEVDMFLKGRARAAAEIGQQVAAPSISIYDDPTIPNSFGGYFFDDEGVDAARAVIVRDGIFLAGLTDLYSATNAGVPRTSHGRRESFAGKAYPRMACTFVGSGDTPVDELIGGVDRGIYLERWSSGMEDPKGWGIQVTCHYGREIVGGRITDRVFGPIGISGYVPEVLRSISAVGSDFKLDGGTCGKGHKEYVRVAAGGPHLRLRARLG